MVVLEKLYNLSRALDGKGYMANPYVYNAFNKGLKNYRLLSSGELVLSELVKDNLIPSYIINFIKDESEVLLIFEFLIKPNYVILRSLKSKAFLGFGISRGLFYGMGDIDLSYNEPIVLVEGPKDRDAIIDLYKNVLALRTNRITKKQIELLKNLTSKVILLLDSDERGQKGSEEAKKALEEVGISVRVLPQFGKLKDTGDIITMEMSGLDTTHVKSYYKKGISILGGKL
jgi:5S rRNA maturation endonuclease (ribonuclease M5)